MANATLIEHLFSELLELPPAQRAARLAELDNNQSDIRNELSSLLAAAEEAKGFLSQPPLAQNPDLLNAADTDANIADLIGQLIGCYRLTQVLGRGGMGAVYLAERDDGHYQQTVAIKLIRPNANAETLVQRFCNERQILAQFAHPNIARLLDGGSHSDGRPYLVMEYIQGEPIDQYCRNRQLSINERLQLFIKVCDAVAYAHQQGVIHRDLKPGNILVDTDGEPKLLDFGIAKLLPANPNVAAEESITLTGCSPLTPDFAAPEQLLNQAITPATDVYALGLLLFEILTEKKPHQSNIERVVTSAETPLPSQLNTARLKNSRLEHEIDRITSQALARRPEQRYQSAQQLVQAIQNLLQTQTLTPQSRFGLLSLKWRAAAAMLLIVFISLLTANPEAIVKETLVKETLTVNSPEQNCEELSSQYADIKNNTAFIQLAQCQLARARTFNDQGHHNDALQVLGDLRIQYQNHPGRHDKEVHAQAGFVLQEYERAAHGRGDFQLARQYRRQQQKHLRRQQRRGG